MGLGERGAREPRHERRRGAPSRLVLGVDAESYPPVAPTVLSYTRMLVYACMLVCVFACLLVCLCTCIRRGALSQSRGGRRDAPWAAGRSGRRSRVSRGDNQVTPWAVTAARRHREAMASPRGERPLDTEGRTGPRRRARAAAAAAAPPPQRRRAVARERRSVIGCK